MNHSDAADDRIRAILEETRTIAIVGASARPERPSNQVLKYLVEKGYEVYPVNPGLAGREIAGRRVFGRLADVPVPIDMVDIFRNSTAAGAVVDEALALTPLPRTIWMQIGVTNDEAADHAEASGVRVVMDRCPKIELGRLRL